MSDSGQPIVDFFLLLQRRMTAGDAQGVAELFAPQFLEIDPTETRPRNNDDVWMAAVEERLACLLLAGMRDVKAVQIDQTPLGANAVLARVRWSMWFTPPGRADFVDEFLVDYLVHPEGDHLAISVSIAHDDDAEVRLRIGLTT